MLLSAARFSLWIERLVKPERGTAKPSEICGSRSLMTWSLLAGLVGKLLLASQKHASASSSYNTVSAVAKNY